MDEDKEEPSIRHQDVIHSLGRVQEYCSIQGLEEESVKERHPLGGVSDGE